MTTSLTTEKEYLQRVEQLEPVLREYDQANERERRLVEPVVDALRAAGMFRLRVPRRYGGSELDPVEACRVVTALAQVDSAAGWNVGLAAAGAGGAHLLGADIADAVYGASPDRVFAVAATTPVFAAAVEDGYVVDGEVPFVSGADYADWFTLTVILMRDGEPVVNAGGAPAILLACAPREAVEVLDRWHTAAMRGTGSTSVKIEGLHLPASRVIELGPSTVAGGRLQAGIHLEAAVSLGIARAALHDLGQLAAAKVAAGGDVQPIQHRERVQHNLALGTALVDAAQAYTTEAMSRAWPDPNVDQVHLDVHDKAALQLSACMAARNAAQAVDLVCEAAGTSSARLEHRFERYFRDVHFLEKHASKSVERFASVGRMLLGMPSGWPLLEL